MTQLLNINYLRLMKNEHPQDGEVTKAVITIICENGSSLNVNTDFFPMQPTGKSYPGHAAIAAMTAIKAISEWAEEGKEPKPSGNN